MGASAAWLEHLLRSAFHARPDDGCRAEEMRGHSIRFALHPGEVESLRCEITVRCVGAGVCGFDDGVK